MAIMIARTAPLLALIVVVAAPARADDPAGHAWWPFRPVRRPSVPAVDDRAGANPIDAFVRDAQGAKGVTPSPEADRVTLIRRLSFDLRGLPPSPAEVEAFLADQSPDACGRLVDRYLADPAFGERWAARWLDLARYADSSGFEDDTRRPDAWRYRDWVVEALNADMPYDRFVRLQLAADEVEPDHPEQKVALGFLRAGPAVGNERNERVRMEELDDIVTTTSAAFLGLTVGCARCHDHRADPIPMEDYYRLVAVFAPARFANVPLASEADVARHRDAVRANEEGLDAVRGALRQAEIAGASSPIGAAAEAECRARIACLERAAPRPLPEAPGVVETTSRAAPVRVLLRGDVDRKRAIVRPGPPTALSGRAIDFPEPPESASTTRRRAALADWIASADNALTARVAVNRIWQGYFGSGLVRTPSDFGASGDPPAMPGLLDWLAAELVARGWSTKAIHRLIVTSATYHQSSRSRPDMGRVDPEEYLVWRHPLRRLDAEEVRDAILSVAGTLDRRRGGPGVFPRVDPSIVRTGNFPRWPLGASDGPETRRRSLYIFRMRSVPLPLLEAFDQPDAARSCPVRSRTNVPTQALTLMNNPFVVDQSRRFADRITREAGPDASARVVLAFRLATGRGPSPSQLKMSLDYLTGPGDLTGLCLMLFNSNAFLYVD